MRCNAQKRYFLSPTSAEHEVRKHKSSPRADVGVFSRGLAHTKRVPTRGSIPRWTSSLCRAVHLLQEDAPRIDRPAARLLELTWSRRLATDSYLQSEHATKHHVCSCLGGCHTGRRPWSARTGRAWLLGVSEESAPRPLEAFLLVRSCSGRCATKFWF